MCQSKVEKEDVFVVQNAVGDNNSSHQQVLHQNMSVIAITLIVICAIVAIAALYGVYKIYRRCHGSWISEHVALYGLRRSFNRGDHRVTYSPNTCQSCNHQHQGDIGIPMSSSMNIPLK